MAEQDKEEELYKVRNRHMFPTAARWLAARRTLPVARRGLAHLCVHDEVCQ